MDELNNEEQLRVFINFGNESLNRLEQAAPLLRQVAERIESGCEGGKILDENGNWVGDFALYRES